MFGDHVLDKRQNVFDQESLNWVFMEHKLYVKKKSHFWYLIMTIFKQEGTADLSIFQPLCLRI